MLLLRNELLGRKRFFPLYSINPGNKCACQKDCGALGKHPKVPWQNHENRTSLPQSNNVGMLTGDGIVVIDCDIKEHVNGDYNLKAYLKECGEKYPETLTALTGGGGKHLYFHSDKKLANAVGILEGVDVRCENGFVVFPGSTHKSGRKYEWDADSDPESTQLEKLPKCLEDLLLKENKTIESSDLKKKKSYIYEPYYLGDKEWDSIKEVLLEKISADCTRERWRKVGMCLYNSGRSDAFDVWDQWSATAKHVKRNGKSIYSKTDNIFQWTTQFQYAPVNLPLEILDMAHVKERPEKDETLKHLEFIFSHKFISLSREEKTRNHQDVYLEQAIQDSKGFVKEYFQFVTSNVRYNLKKLHFLAGFSALASVSQRAFLSPTGSSLSLYILGFAPTGRGKDDVNYYLKQAVERVDEKLLVDQQYKSTQALLNDLKDYNTRFQFVDECHTFFAPIMKADQKSILYDFNGLLMELWSHKEYIRGSKSLMTNIKKIKEPKLSLYGTSAMTGLEEFKDKKAIRSGFINRFLIAVCDEFPKCFHEAERKELPMEFIETLGRIYATEQKKNPKDRKLLWDSKEASEYYEAITDRLDKKREHLESRGEHDEASLFARYSEQIVRLASLHALGDSRQSVSLEDLKIAEKIMFSLSIDSILLLDLELRESQFSLMKNKVINFLRIKKRHTRYSATLKELSKKLGVKTAVAEDLLNEMAHQDLLIHQIQKNEEGNCTKVYKLAS